jgi:hypothetical protein
VQCEIPFRKTRISKLCVHVQKEGQTKTKMSYIKAFMYQFLVRQQQAGQQEAKMKTG